MFTCFTSCRTDYCDDFSHIEEIRAIVNTAKKKRWTCLSFVSANMLTLLKKINAL